MKEPNILEFIWSVMTLTNEYMDNALILRLIFLSLYGFPYSIFVRTKLRLFYTTWFERLFARLYAPSFIQKILVKIFSLILNTLTAWFIVRMSAYGSFCVIDWYYGLSTTKMWDFLLQQDLRLFVKRIGLEKHLITPEAQQYLRTLHNIKHEIHTWLNSLIERIEALRDKLRSK